MNLKRYHTLAALTLFLTTGQLIPAGVHAKSVDLTGNWRTYFSGSDLEETDSGLTQYHQRYDARWKPTITRQINFSADVGYSNNWIMNLGTREMITPTLNFDVFNDIFSFNLAGYATQHNISYSADRETYAWDSNLNSTWLYDLWPTLTLRFGQRWEERDQLRHTLADGGIFNHGGEDSLFSYGGGAVTWEGYHFRLLYDYYLADTDDRGDNSSLDEERQLGQIEYVNMFWKNRINVSLSQTVGHNTSDFSGSAGGDAVKVLAGSGFAGDDLTPSSGRLPQNRQLVDGNLDTRAFTIRLQQPANLALRTDFRTIDQIYVYTTKDSNLLVANTAAVTWDLYTSTDGFAWQRVAERVTSVFNRDEFRFEVSTGTVRAGYVKLVATGWLPTIDIEVTELEARTFLTGADEEDFSTTSDQYKTEAYLGIIPIENTHLDYTFSRDDNDNTSGRQERAENEQLVHTARFSWDYSQYFSPSVGYSTVSNTYSQAVDTESRSYDLQINSVPLPTLDNNLSIVHNEYYEDGALLLTSENILLTSLATLYPDLTSELSLGWSLSEEDQTQDQNDSYYIRWLLRSRLRKSLTADFTTEYRTSEADTEVPIEDHLGQGFTILQTSGDSGLNSLEINWRPSDLWSMRATGISVWGDEEGADTERLLLTVDYLALRTSKTNVTLSYNFNASPEETYNNFGFVWSWDFSRFFTLHTNGYYLISELENAWYLSTQLTARL